MNKAQINGLLGRFGFEIHGTGFIQALKKSSFKDDPFQRQKELIGTDRPVIFDIGANRGDITDVYLNLFPRAIIHAFEPFPESFKILQNRFLDKPSVHCHNLAISESNDEKEFYVNRNVDTNSLLKPRRAGLSSDSQVINEKVIRVRSTSIDNFATEMAIESIDILKMDIQGGEFSALVGAMNCLSKRKVRCIYSEVYFIRQYEGQPLFHSIAELLYGQGFSLQDIYSPIYGNGNIAWADAIFIARDL